MSRVTRSTGSNKKDVRAQGSYSQGQIGANVDMETNADNDALIDNWRYNT